MVSKTQVPIIYANFVQMAPAADIYFTDGCGRCALGGTPACKVHSWQPELAAFRAILLSSGLTEEVKWGMPCYTMNGRNVAILGSLKDSCTLSFFKGVLLEQEFRMLEKPGPNSRETRQIVITGAEQIMDNEEQIRQCIARAMELETEGAVITRNPEDLPPMPAEFAAIMAADPELMSAYEKLTPGRKRGYLLFFNAAKQAQTRISRIEKWIPAILQGKGMHDR